MRKGRFIRRGRFNARSAIGFPAADQEAMRIVFEDGTSQECSPTDQREIIAEAGFHPVQGIPKRLKRVSDTVLIQSRSAQESFGPDIVNSMQPHIYSRQFITQRL